MQLLSGNEAIAQGAWEAGARIGVGYPGTPSTETMESFGAKENVYAEWCANEKVAVEVAVGASAAGARVLATMKHVGVNVAADPLYTAAYTGVNGGLVVLAADDPGMHSSQNEQDTRFHAQGAHIPVVEPSDSAEAREYTMQAFEASERFDIPFFVRSTVRVSHAKSPVEVGERTERDLIPYEKDPSKWVMMPAYAKPRRTSLDARIAQVAQWAETSPLNRLELNDTSIGVICAGASYQYVRDALPNASILKLGITWPIATGIIAKLANHVDALYVVEEGSDYLSMQIKATGVAVSEPPAHALPKEGELTPGIIRSAFGLALPEELPTQQDVPGRPPALCAGCPHRLVFKELSRAKCIVTGDIGCYTLGALPPLAGMDSTLDMGASISMAHGFELALAGTEHHPIVAVIGDSTFGHSGFTSLLSTAYNKGAGTICILDNRTTGMTGHQGNPFNGITLQNRPSRELDLEGMVRSLGISDVQVVNPNNMKDVRAAIKGATSRTEELSVIIFRSPCVLLKKVFERQAPYTITSDCRACGVCVTLGCPAIARIEETGEACIDPDQCVGCGQCQAYCGFGAIVRMEGALR